MLQPWKDQSGHETISEILEEAKTGRMPCSRLLGHTWIAFASSPAQIAVPRWMSKRPKRHESNG